MERGRGKKYLFQQQTQRRKGVRTPHQPSLSMAYGIETLSTSSEQRGRKMLLLHFTAGHIIIILSPPLIHHHSVYTVRPIPLMHSLKWMLRYGGSHENPTATWSTLQCPSCSGQTPRTLQASERLRCGPSTCSLQVSPSTPAQNRLHLRAIMLCTFLR